MNLGFYRGILEKAHRSEVMEDMVLSSFNKKSIKVLYNYDIIRGFSDCVGFFQRQIFGKFNVNLQPQSSTESNGKYSRDYKSYDVKRHLSMQKLMSLSLR
ncbi:hypothetical protein MUK42_33525 [Musa troglodytarum]|uniref:Uncharacterized protein n=1 Tax=Musa troglodytarum TaxID=320322 RepID=A0A9E7LFN3_9LILI|nr:hypothetical protein MUK42_33525 [Musa troglodytarum]